MHSTDVSVSLNYLKSALIDLIENIMDNRQLCRDIAEFIYQLHPPLSDEITAEVLKEGSDYLNHYKNQAEEYITELESIMVLNI